MTAAELSFFVFFVAGALPRLFDLDLVLRKLRRSLRSRSADFASRQRLPSFSRRSRRRNRPTSVIVLEAESRDQRLRKCCVPLRIRIHHEPPARILFSLWPVLPPPVRQ